MLLIIDNKTPETRRGQVKMTDLRSLKISLFFKRSEFLSYSRSNVSSKCSKLESLSVQCLYISLSSQYRAPASQSNLRDLASPFCKATGRLGKRNWIFFEGAFTKKINRPWFDSDVRFSTSMDLLSYTLCPLSGWLICYY